MGIFDSIKRKLGNDIKNSNGINEEYANKGLIRRKYFKKNGKLDGKYIEYIVGNDNWIKAEIDYENGLKNGLSKYYWKKYLSAEGNFYNDKEKGVIKKYFEVNNESDLKKHPRISKLADLDNGVFEEYSHDGILLEKSQIITAKFNKGSSSSEDGNQGGIYPVKNGLSEVWHENGNKFKKGEWINNIPSGLHEVYYSDGNIEFEIEYRKIDPNSFNFPKQGIIVKEKWYNNDGSLMNPNQIIEKGGIDPAIKYSKPSHLKISLANQEIINKRNEEKNIIINDLKFLRRGDVSFHLNYYDLGHSYRLHDQVKKM